MLLSDSGVLQSSVSQTWLLSGSPCGAGPLHQESAFESTGGGGGLLIGAGQHWPRSYSWGPLLQSPAGCWMGSTLVRDSHEMARFFLGLTHLTHTHMHAHMRTLALYHPEFLQISQVSFHTLFYFSTLKISRKTLGCILCLYSYTNIGTVDSCYSQESCSRKSPWTLK